MSEKYSEKVFSKGDKEAGEHRLPVIKGEVDPIKWPIESK
jgi:hypothetical protein